MGENIQEPGDPRQGESLPSQEKEREPHEEIVYLFAEAERLRKEADADEAEAISDDLLDDVRNPVDRLDADMEQVRLSRAAEAKREQAALFMKRVAELKARHYPELVDDNFTPGETKEKKNEERTPLDIAEHIMGHENLLGPRDVEKVFGIRLEKIPPIPFSEEELENAKKLGQHLVLQVDTMMVKSFLGLGQEISASLTLKNLTKRFKRASDGNRMFWGQDWFEDEQFFTEERPRTGWKLVSKGVLGNSLSQSFLTQSDEIACYVSGEVRLFDGNKYPTEYQAAVSELSRQRRKMWQLMLEDPKEASHLIADLKITKLTRELPVEVMYRLILEEQARGKRLLYNKYTWTGTRDSTGEFVTVGYFDLRGVRVGRQPSNIASENVGVCFSRMS